MDCVGTFPADISKMHAFKQLINYYSLPLPCLNVVLILGQCI